MTCTENLNLHPTHFNSLSEGHPFNNLSLGDILWNNVISHMYSSSHKRPKTLGTILLSSDFRVHKGCHGRGSGPQYTPR